MNKLALVVLMGSLCLVGCATGQSEKRDVQVAEPAPPVVVQPPVKLTAIGYGATSTFDGYTPGQKRLMAMRASKLDAYRALAEQIYGVRVVGNSTVSALAAQNDSFRVYVNAFVRGSRLLSVTAMADGNYETELEIEVDQNFYDNFRKGAVAPAGSATPSGIKGAVGPGGAYGTNFHFAE